jgi:TetR/AcrR family transcriptional regulator, cholesterol catabolism regulator
MSLSSNLRSPSRAAVPGNGTRFEQQLGKILLGATAVFCEKGYEGASMRDIAQATGMSLAGMYHYFGNKERLLYLIQKDSFSTILARLRERLSSANDPESGIRIFILNHLQYFLEHQQAMKVLSHEDDVLKGEYGQEIAQIKREYYRICRELLDRYQKAKGLEFESRTAVLALFGMMNWIYTWYNPRLDGDAERLSREMGDIFLGGIARSEKRNSRVSHRRGRSPNSSQHRAAVRKRNLSFA